VEETKKTEELGTSNPQEEEAKKDAAPPEITRENVDDWLKDQEDDKPEEKQVEEQPKKKYLGVAKMRRRKLMEQKQQVEVTSKGTEDAVFVPIRKKKKRINNTLPILMHVVTVMLLFLAGLDVGLQQNRSEMATVQSDFAPRQYGLQVLRGRSSTPKAPVLDTETPEDWQANTVEDEFGDVDDLLDDEKEENMDPLFRVDLDKMTEGPGLFMFLARGAVAGHRLNLAIFYYFPQRVYHGILTTFAQLAITPPILCLVALTIRQLVAKVILGAKLPDKVVDETQHKDVMTMIKQFVSGFILKAFPTGVSLYDAFVHLRADMYVVLFGLLVGLAFNHQLTGIELPPVEEVMDTVLVEDQPLQDEAGVSDEL